ncbi:MAG: hypothetical protein M2R45_00920 [Verrucomicrobia subdivision 3 bacterium]|nr:hypothetical protein [Limisphaerales bacterium]MCS1414589.1 hypothetical protein [Limisphaerales bacterium]
MSREIEFTAIDGAVTAIKVLFLREPRPAIRRWRCDYAQILSRARRL